jgi:hypothetical protein
MSLRMQPQNERSSPSSSLAGSNAVESGATLMEFAAAPHAPKHGPGNTHHNTVITRNTLNSADPVDVGAQSDLFGATAPAIASPPIAEQNGGYACGLLRMDRSRSAIGARH